MAPTKQTLTSLALLGLAAAQTPGDGPEVHPQLETFKCTKADGCTSQASYVVLDSLSHWVHQKDDESANCGSWGSGADPEVCPDKETCAENCIMEGMTLEDYTAHGITTDGASLRLDMFADDGSTLSPRVYLLAPDDENYELFQLTPGEFSFDVDMSKLPCGMNGALYMSEMEPDGGKSELNPGGAHYGTGYCDAQCYATPFANGEANLDGKGVCCNELDIWEANARANQLAPHTCSEPGLYLCEGDECGREGVCDKNGCGWNPYRNGSPEYYGLGYTVDTSQVFSVVTQFVANDGGELTEIHRKYVQNGEVIENAVTNVSSLPKQNFLNDEYCEATGGTDAYFRNGATKGMGESLARGMVLAMSIWWSEGGDMLWLDGNGAGPCTAADETAEAIREAEPFPSVVFSNIKWGEIGSTFEENPQGSC